MSKPDPKLHLAGMTQEQFERVRANRILELEGEVRRLTEQVHEWFVKFDDLKHGYDNLLAERQDRENFIASLKAQNAALMTQVQGLLSDESLSKRDSRLTPAEADDILWIMTKFLSDVGIKSHKIHMEKLRRLAEAK